MGEEIEKENTGLPLNIIQKDKHGKAPLPEVVTVRNWKEYLGESILIIFSVVLALILTEIFNKIHEEGQTKQVLHQLREELMDNKRLETEQYAYHRHVLKNIDSVLQHPKLANSFIDSGEVNLRKTLHFLAPFGVRQHELNTVAWEVARQNNAFSGMDLSTYELLTDIYDSQQHITGSEEKIGNLLLSWESRKPGNFRTMLILLRDNYLAWAVDRAPALLVHYQEAINKLQKY
jgi:hypothetical protein